MSAARCGTAGPTLRRYATTTTPKEGRQSPDSFKDTSHLTKWQTSKISPPRPQYSSKKHGKRHIPAPWAKSNMRAVIAEQGPAVPKQAANIFRPKLGCNR